MIQYPSNAPEFLPIEQIESFIETLESLSRSKEKKKALPTELAAIHGQIDTLFDELAARDLERASKLAIKLDRIASEDSAKTCRYFKQKNDEFRHVIKNLFTAYEPRDLLNAFRAADMHPLKCATAKYSLFATLKQHATSTKHTREDRKFYTLSAYNSIIKHTGNCADVGQPAITLRDGAHKAFTLVAMEICTERCKGGGREMVLDEKVIGTLHNIITTSTSDKTKLSAQRALGEIYQNLSKKDRKKHFKNLYTNGKPHEDIHAVAVDFVPLSALPSPIIIGRLEKITRPTNWPIVGGLFRKLLS